MSSLASGCVTYGMGCKVQTPVKTPVCASFSLGRASLACCCAGPAGSEGGVAVS